MKLSRTAVIVISLVGLLLAAPATDVRAASTGNGIQLNLNARWNSAPVAGAWTPYVVTVKNQGPAAFSGLVQLIPSNRYQQPAYQYPTYQARLNVPRGEQRSQTLYVVDAPLGYQAQLQDLSGHVVATAAATPAAATAAVAVLSDLPQAAETIAAPLRALTQQAPAVTRFDSVHSLPANAVYLAGLAGIIIDQFDSAGLSQAQVQTLRDFVGLGGTVILAGGASWRRTLLPLPVNLLPLKPEATGTASLAPLAEMAGTTTNATAQVVVGQLQSGRIVLRAPDGNPLIVEARYGAGRIVQLTFDPLTQPFDADLSLTAAAWSQAVTRAADPTPRDRFGSAPATSALQGGPLVSSPGSAYSPPDLTPIYNLLQDRTSSGLPPASLLAALLIFYIVLAGLVNYLALRSIGKRGLMWFTTPAMALLFSAGAYAVGFGSRGSDYQDNEVQLLRVAPDGAVESQSFHGLYSPRRGDYTVRVPSDTLASTALGGTGGQSADRSVVVLNGRPAIRLSDVPVATSRSLQTLAVSRPPSLQVLDAHLRVTSGHLVGTVANHGRQTVGPVQLFVMDRDPVTLAAQLPPGHTLNVDVAVGSLPSEGHMYSDDRRSQAASLGAASVAGISDLTLVAVGSGSSGLQVDNGQPSLSSLAAIVQPLQLESSDALVLTPRQRLVSTITTGNGLVDVYDFQLPSGYRKSVSLDLSALVSQTGVRSVEVYDWVNGTWRALPMPGPGASQPAPVPLSSFEGGAGPGLVRIRVQESALAQARVELSGP
jgi:hypothetical protein